jgi:hypothetical protein
MENNTLHLFSRIAIHRVNDHYLPKLLYTLKHLNIGQLWEQEEGLNSIGGIILHVCEHIKRNTSSYINSQVVYSKGIEDYFPNSGMAPHEMRSHVQETFKRWNNHLSNLLTVKNYENIDMHELFHVVEHTGYHLGQIVDRAKRITGKQFNFCQNGLNESKLRAIIEEYE